MDCVFSQRNRVNLDISDAKVSNIIGLARALEKTTRAKNDAAIPWSPTGEDELSLRGTALVKLRKAIERLSDDEQIVLLALAAIGEGRFTPAEFDGAVVAAFQQRSRVFAEWLSTISVLAGALESGVAACRAAPPTGS